MAISRYIAPHILMDWLRQPLRYTIGIFVILKAVPKSLEIITTGLIWRIQSSTAMRIGEDPWIGCGNAHRISIDLKTHLSAVDINHISYLDDPNHTTMFQKSWKSARILQIPEQWEQLSADYIAALTEAHIRIVEGEDEIIWVLSKSGK